LCACPGGTVDTDGGTTGVDGGGTTGPTTTKSGNVILTQSSTKILDMTYCGGIATAAFSTTVVGAGMANPCVVTTSGSCTATRCGTFNRANALPVTWTGGTTGNVSVTLSTTTSAGSTVIICTFAASAGTGSVPTDMLSKLDAAQGYLITGSSNVTDVAAGGYAVKLHAMGSGAVGQVVVQ